MEGWLDQEWFGAMNPWRMSIDVWVKDLRASATSFAERFGFGPWKYTELKAPLLFDARFRGEPANVDMAAAMSSIGPLNIELLEVRSGSPAVLEWAEKLPDAYWHPVLYHASADEADEAFAEFEARGFEAVLSGKVAGSNFYMMDASPLLGRMLEIAGGPLTTVSWSPDAP